MPSRLERSYAVRPLGEGMDPRLYPYQQAAVESVIKGWHQHAIFGHHPGKGKTPMALCAANEALKLGGQVIVVCPPAIVDQWALRVKEWCLIEPNIVRHGRGVREALTRDGLTIVPDSIIHHQVGPIRPHATIIIDEVHRFKERSAVRTRAVFGGKRTNVFFGDRTEDVVFAGLTTQAARILALTGTPVIASPVDLFPVLCAMKFPEARTFKGYTERYCPPYKVQVHTGRQVIETSKYDRVQNIEELARKLREAYIIRPALEAYEDQLPSVRTEIFPVDIDDPADVPEGTILDATSFNDPALAQVRRLTGINKASAAKAYLETLIAGGDRPIIWCWHQEVAMKIASDLGCPYIHGGVPIPVRQDRCRQFISGAHSAMVLTIAAAGTGLDGLQHATDLCVFVEEAFTPAENEQALARIHRLGQRGSVRRVRVVSRTLVDRVVEQANIRKAANAEGTLQ